MRELENILERAVALSEGNELGAADLHLPKVSRAQTKHAGPANGGPRHSKSTRIDSLPVRKPGHVAHAATERATDARSVMHLPVTLPSQEAAAQPADPEGYLGTIERDLILKTLQDTKYNRTRAAEKLGITFRALRYKLKKLGIE